MFRLRLDRDAGRIVIDERWRPRYGPAPGPQLRLGPGDHRRARLLDGQRAQPHRPDDARQRRGSRARCGCGGRAATTARVALGRDQRPALRDRVEPAGLGSRAAGSSSPTTPATPSLRAWRLVGRRARAALAPRRLRPRRPPDPLSRTRASSSSRTGATPPRCAGRSCGRALRPASRQVLARSARGPPRLARRPAATSSSCSTSTPARRRRGSTSPRPSQGFLFPAPGLRARRLLPVADHDRPRRRRLTASAAPGAQPGGLGVLHEREQPLDDRLAASPRRRGGPRPGPRSRRASPRGPSRRRSPRRPARPARCACRRPRTASPASDLLELVAGRLGLVREDRDEPPHVVALAVLGHGEAATPHARAGRAVGGSRGARGRRGPPRGLGERGAEVAEHDRHRHHVAGGRVVRREDRPHPKAQLRHVRPSLLPRERSQSCVASARARRACRRLGQLSWTTRIRRSRKPPSQ